MTGLDARAPRPLDHRVDQPLVAADDVAHLLAAAPLLSRAPDMRRVRAQR